MIVVDCRLINVPNTYPYLTNVPETCECALIWQNNSNNNKKAGDVIKLRVLRWRDPVLGGSEMQSRVSL